MIGEGVFAKSIGDGVKDDVSLRAILQVCMCPSQLLNESVMGWFVFGPA